MRRWVMRTLSKVCGYLTLGVDFFEERGMYRIAGLVNKMYWGVDQVQWTLTKRNIQRVRDKQRRERENHNHSTDEQA